MHRMLFSHTLRAVKSCSSNGKFGLAGHAGGGSLQPLGAITEEEWRQPEQQLVAQVPAGQIGDPREIRRAAARSIRILCRSGAVATSREYLRSTLR